MRKPTTATGNSILSSLLSHSRYHFSLPFLPLLPLLMCLSQFCLDSGLHETCLLIVRRYSGRIECLIHLSHQLHLPPSSWEGVFTFDVEKLLCCGGRVYGGDYGRVWSYWGDYERLWRSLWRGHMRKEIDLEWWKIGGKEEDRSDKLLEKRKKYWSLSPSPLIPPSCLVDVQLEVL